MKPPYIFAAIVAAAAALASCAMPLTFAQQRANVLISTTRTANQQMRACADNMFASPSVSILLPYIPRNWADPTPAQLANSTYPNAKQIAALHMFYDMAQNCRTQFVNAYATVEPQAAAISIDIYQKMNAQMQLLMQNEQSWGAFITAMQQIASVYNEEEEREADRINGRIREENNVEIAHLSRSLQQTGTALQNTNGNYNSQSFTPPPPPSPPNDSGLSGMYTRPPVPHGCVGQVPVSGPGFNPCPSP
ncbi:MAG TPA: hypothetical protein VIJ62_12500 [Rhizomicrobium sp.]